MKYAAISASGSGANAIVAAVPGKRIRVAGYVLSFGGTVNAKWQSASTDLSGLIYGLAATFAQAAPMPKGERGGQAGHFETAAGEALNLNLSGAVAVGGHLAYEEVQ